MSSQTVRISSTGGKTATMDITTAPSHCSVTLTVLSLIARPSTASSFAGRTIRLSKTTTLEGSSMFGWAYMESTDWYDLFYKDYNWSTEHNLSVSGGGDMADYYISGRFYDMDGIYKVGNEDYKKYDLRAKER